MGHTSSCETARTHTCVCPCGNARHGAILIRGIASSDQADRDKAIGRAEPRRWRHLPEATRRTTVNSTVSDRHPAVTGVVSELVITLIEQIRDDREIDAIESLASHVSYEIGEELERHLDGGGPDHRGTRHLWCVVMATICRVYDQGFDLVHATVDKAVEEVMDDLGQDISVEQGDASKPRDIYQRKRIVVSAFELAEYTFLEALVKKAVGAITTAIRAIGEETVFKHLRLIGVIMCPDPDRHPDVVRHCVWPFVSGPLAGMVDDSIAAEMRGWLRNAYRVVPAIRAPL